jgi:hypothetical protein
MPSSVSWATAVLFAVCDMDSKARARAVLWTDSHALEASEGGLWTGGGGFSMFVIGVRILFGGCGMVMSFAMLRLVVADETDLEAMIVVLAVTGEMLMSSVGVVANL